MIALLPAVTCVAYFASAVAVLRRKRGAEARHAAVLHCTMVSAISAGLTAIGPWMPSAPIVPANGMAMVPVLLTFSALLAVSLAPLATHPPATLARILSIAGCSQLCLATTAPMVIALAWSLSAYIAWTELSGHPERRLASRVFGVLHTVSSGLLITGAALLAYGHSAAGGTFVLIGIAVHAAVLPLHSWFVPLCEVAPFGLIAVFVAPQIAVYAYLETVSEVVPYAVSVSFAAVVAVTAIAAAGLGLVQVAARRAVAFVLMGQTALVILGAASQSVVARTGALVTWQSLILATSGFAMAIGAAEARCGYLSLHGRGYQLAGTPRLAVAVLVFGLACVGFPLTLGFVGEDLLIQGASFPGLAFVPVVVTAANGVTVLRWFLHLFAGAPGADAPRDLRSTEVRAIAVALAMLFVTGAAPKLIITGDEPPPPGHRTAVPRAGNLDPMPSVVRTVVLRLGQTVPSSPDTTGVWPAAR